MDVYQTINTFSNNFNNIASQTNMATNNSSDLDMDKLFEEFSQAGSLANISSNDLNKVLARNNFVDDEKYNCCDECNIHMEYKRDNDEYHCPQCGMIKTSVGGSQSANELGNDRGGGYVCIRRNNSTVVYSLTSDYAKTQKKCIYEQLLGLNRESNMHLPKDVLENTAEYYNNIQKTVVDTDDDDAIAATTGGKPAGKRFVRRGCIKNEILAAILYYVCAQHEITHKKKDIAAFMKLQSGFSRGESILRGLMTEGKIQFVNNDDINISTFISRYMEGLDIDNDEYSDFVKEIIDVSEARNIGIDSNISSKIVGALWLLICGAKLNITAEIFESHTDKCKRNTYMKFYNCVRDYPTIFKPIFDKYKIAFPVSAATKK